MLKFLRILLDELKSPIPLLIIDSIHYSFKLFLINRRSIFVLIKPLTFDKMRL